jgi:hypothetical protein
MGSGLATTGRGFMGPGERGTEITEFDIRADYPKNQAKLSGTGVPSALSQLKFGINGLEFTACIVDLHLPINASLRGVNVA